MQQLLLPTIESPSTSSRWNHIEEQAYEHGQVYDSYFATEDNWKRYRVKGLDGLFSYRRLGKYVKVVGGLLASDAEKPRLLREYTHMADSFGLVTSFYNVVEQDLDLFRKYGYQITKWGEEPIVDLAKCTWSGKQYEWVRRQTNYCRRAGIRIVEHRRDEMDDESWTELLRELRKVSDSLLATKPQSGEIQLVEGQLEVAGWGRRRVFVAYTQDPTPRIEGFLIALPMDGGRRWSFEMYRHRPDAVRGSRAPPLPRGHDPHEGRGDRFGFAVPRPRTGLRRGRSGSDSAPHSPVALLRKEAFEFHVRRCRPLPLQEPLPAPL